MAFQFHIRTLAFAIPKSEPLEERTRAIGKPLFYPANCGKGRGKKITKEKLEKRKRRKVENKSRR
jgi:hypothetical protein